MICKIVMELIICTLFSFSQDPTVSYSIINTDMDLFEFIVARMSRYNINVQCIPFVVFLSPLESLKL